MRNLVGLLAVLILSTAPAGWAGTSTYKCDSDTVDKEARAVAYTSVAVGVHSNGQAHICTFSIDAAHPDGAQPGLGPGPVVGLLESAIGGDSAALAIRIFIPRGEIDGSLVEELASLLHKSAADLKLCLASLQSGGDMPEPMAKLDDGALLYLSLEGDRIQLDCSVFPPGDSAVLSTPVPTMRLRARLQDGSTDNLYVPVGAL